jgi:hypothetical protein
MPKIVRFEEVILFPQSHLARSHGDKLQAPSRSRKAPAYAIGGLVFQLWGLDLAPRVIGLMVHAGRRMDKLDMWLIPRRSSHFAENL